MAGGRIPPDVYDDYMRVWFCREMGWTFAEYDAADYWDVLRAYELLRMLPPARGG